MPKPPKAKLPPIAVEDKSEKLALALPSGLHTQLEQFSEFFVAETGQKPTSMNAVIVGVIAGYMDSHRGFQKWRKTKVRGAGSAA